MRAHVSARIRVGPDGERVLLPPGEAVGLAARADDPAGLARALARHSGAADEAAALRDAIDQLEARLAITGEARLGGVGVFQRSGSGIRFGVAPELLAAVNRSYEALPPISVAPASGTPEPSEAPAAPPVAAPPVAAPPAAARPTPVAPPAPPPDAVDILLDLIVNEPAEGPEAAAPEASPNPEANRAEPVPSESAFFDEPAEDELVDPLEDEPVLAVPFGVGDVDLHEVLPPTPPERDPGLEAPDIPEEPAPVPSASVPAEAAHEASRDEAEMPPTPPYRAIPDGPPLVEAATPPVDRPVAPAPRPGRSLHLAGWLLYAAVVLALAALLLWWVVEERRADPPAILLTILALRPL